MAPNPFIESVRFDGKHWIGKKRPGETLQIESYQHVAKQAKKTLGKNGIVAIPNARVDEKRYEEFVNRGREYGLIKIDSGNASYDPVNEIYFMKAQEIKTKTRNIPITVLAYNVPFGKNLNDKNLQQVMEDADKMNCFLGINLPACARSIEDALCASDNLLGNIDFVVGYSSSAALFWTNESSIEFYRKEIKENEFCNPFSKEIHKVGVIAVSGGHRTPKTILGNVLSGFGQTLGRAYTEIPEPKKDNFMNDLRRRLRNATEQSIHKDSIIAETLLRYIPSTALDKIAGVFK